MVRVILTRLSAAAVVSASKFSLVSVRCFVITKQVKDPREKANPRFVRRAIILRKPIESIGSSPGVFIIDRFFDLALTVTSSVSERRGRRPSEKTADCLLL